VTINEVIDYGEWENNTKSESYFFSIKNNESVELYIPYFEVSGLAGLNSSELEKVDVYINTDLTYASSDGKTIKPYMRIQPYGVGNITVIIPRQKNLNKNHYLHPNSFNQLINNDLIISKKE